MKSHLDRDQYDVKGFGELSGARLRAAIVYWNPESTAVECKRHAHKGAPDGRNTGGQRKRGQPGAGFLVAGTAAFLTAGEDFERVKAKFPWARAALKVTVASVTQTR